MGRLGLAVSIATLGLAATMLPVRASDDWQMLAQAIADQMAAGSAAVLTVGAAPRDWALPLPRTQFAHAGWSAAGKTVGTDVASARYSIVDARKHVWASVLTVYRSNTDAKTVYAFVDVTDESNKDNPSSITVNVSHG